MTNYPEFPTQLKDITTEYFTMLNYRDRIFRRVLNHTGKYTPNTASQCETCGHNQRCGDCGCTVIREDQTHLAIFEVKTGRMTYMTKIKPCKIVMASLLLGVRVP